MAHRSDSPSALSSLLCFNFYRGWRGISEFYRKFLPEGISAQQSYILELCKTDEGILVGDLAHQLEIDISAVSGLLKRMEKSQLIRREMQPSNRRQTLVFLTLRAEELRQEIHRSMQVASQELSQVIENQDRLTLIRMVDQIRQLLTAQP